MIQVFQYPSFASLMISRSCAVSQNLSSQQCAHLIKNATFRCWISKTILKYIQRSQKVCQCTHRYAVHYTDYTVTILYTNKWEVLKYWRKGYRQWQRQSLPPLRAQPIDHMSDGQAYGFSWHQAEVESFSVCIRFSTLNILIYIYIDPESPQNLGSYNVSNSSQLVTTWAHSEESSRLAWQTSGLR